MTGEDRTTPRPWTVTEKRGKRDGYVKSGDRTVADCRYRNGEADAALIVEAVNNYDRLRAIEEAARAFIKAQDGDTGDPGQDAENIWNAVADLRAALEGAPHE